MVVTIKHSGSLVTLSSQGFAAKNSLDNEYSAGAAVLLQAHFVRLLGCEAAAQQRLAALMDALQQRQLAISFEMVTGERSLLLHAFGFGDASATLNAETHCTCVLAAPLCACN